MLASIPLECRPSDKLKVTGINYKIFKIIINVNVYAKISTTVWGTNVTGDMLTLRGGPDPRPAGTFSKLSKQRSQTLR